MASERDRIADELDIAIARLQQNAVRFGMTPEEGGEAGHLARVNKAADDIRALFAVAALRGEGETAETMRGWTKEEAATVRRNIDRMTTPLEGETADAPKYRAEGVLETDPRPGEVWKHASGRDYRIIEIGLWEPNPECSVVIYTSVERGPVWVRSLDVFRERFTFVPPAKEANERVEESSTAEREPASTSAGAGVLDLEGFKWLVSAHGKAAEIYHPTLMKAIGDALVRIASLEAERDRLQGRLAGIFSLTSSVTEAE